MKRTVDKVGSKTPKLSVGVMVNVVVKSPASRPADCSFECGRALHFSIYPIAARLGNKGLVVYVPMVRCILKDPNMLKN